MTHSNISKDQNAKKNAGYAAAELIQDGMLVGLGTGSTAAYFIERLIERFNQGLKIEAVATSLSSENMAKKGGIPILDINDLSFIDLTVDGADEIDKHKQMIKGGGGALLREKMVATMSGEMVVVVDESKCVDKLGKFPLPVEIVTFAYRSILDRFEKLSYFGKLREKNSQLFITDNGNYIYDIFLDKRIENPKHLHQTLKEIVGVVETGLFYDIAGRLVVGHNDGTVKIL